MTAILTAIVVLVGMWVFLFYLLPYILNLSGKSYLVRSVPTKKPAHFGQLRFSEDCLQFRSIRLNNLHLVDIEIIEGYVETTSGLEEVSCVDFVFNNGRKIFFDGSKSDQQDLINEILLALHADQVNWSSEFGPFTFDKVILYKR